MNAQNEAVARTKQLKVEIWKELKENLVINV